MKLTGILCLSLLSFSAVASAQSVGTVRGMLQDNSGKKPLPASGFQVTLEGKSYTSPAVKSGMDGLYYIPNVAPGNYTLKVWVNPKNPLSFPITVKGQLTDVPPVVVTPASSPKPKTHSNTKAKPAPPAAKSGTVAAN
jgi:hypothetical protein